MEGPTAAQLDCALKAEAAYDTARAAGQSEVTAVAAAKTAARLRRREQMFEGLGFSPEEARKAAA